MPFLYEGSFHNSFLNSAPYFQLRLTSIKTCVSDWPTEDNITITGQNKTPAVLHCNVVANRSVTYVWMDETNGRIITRGPTIIANHGGNYTCIASTIINRRYFCQAKSVNVLGK